VIGTKDEVGLSAQERAALSNLEARATAADPGLAARLAGRGRSRPFTRMSRAGSWLARWARSAWTAAAAILVGLSLTAVGVSVGLAVGVVGVVLLGSGLWSAVSLARRRRAGRPRRRRT
jgi:Protein of unknown function (DUF3040)